jgi:hypothetical protein
MKALLARWIPYLHDTHHLMQKVLLMADELEFVLHVLVTSCESADPDVRRVKIPRFLELLKDLATCPTNQKAFLDARSTLLGLTHGDHDVITQEVLSPIASTSSSSIPPDWKALLPGTTVLLHDRVSYIQYRGRGTLGFPSVAYVPLPIPNDFVLVFRFFNTVV